MYEAASKFSDEQFLMKLAYLAYLSDVFQGRDKHLPHLVDKLTAFTESSRYGAGTSIQEILNLSEVAETSDSGATTVIPCIKQHISYYFKNTSQTAVLSMTGLWIHSMGQVGILVFYFID